MYGGPGGGGGHMRSHSFPLQPSAGSAYPMTTAPPTPTTQPQPHLLRPQPPSMYTMPLTTTTAISNISPGSVGGGGEWMNPTAAPTTATDWSSGYGFPMKEHDSSTGTSTTGSEMSSYDYYAYEMYKQQSAVAAAATGVGGVTQPTATYTDPYSGQQIDMQSYQAAYAAAYASATVNQPQQTSPGTISGFYPTTGLAPTATTTTYDPTTGTYLQQPYQPTTTATGLIPSLITPQPTATFPLASALTPTSAVQQQQHAAAAAAMNMNAAFGWVGGMQSMPSPARLHALTQLQKGFGSTGHGAEPGPRERRERHAEDAIDKDPLTYRTEICRTHLTTGHCDYGATCQFAHGVGELRSREFDSKYKTELYDEYRVRASEYEFWLVSPSENLVRVELVDPRNAQRLEQLTALVNSPPKPPVSPLKPTERTLFQQQLEEEKSKYDQLPALTASLEQLKVEPSIEPPITKTESELGPPHPQQKESSHPPEVAADPPESRPPFAADVSPSTDSIPTTGLSPIPLSASESPVTPATRLHLRSPLTRVKLEESLGPSTVPPTAALTISNVLHSPKMSPSHHVQEDRRARLMELARTESGEQAAEKESENEEAGPEELGEHFRTPTEPSTIQPTKLNEESQPFEPHPSIESTSTSEQKQQPLSVNTDSSPPDSTPSTFISSPSTITIQPPFERVSQQDVRIGGGGGVEPIHRPYRERGGGRFRGGGRRGGSYGGGGGGGMYHHDSHSSSDLPIYHQQFQPLFSSSFAPTPPMTTSTMMGPNLLQKYTTQIPFSSHAYEQQPRISNSPIIIESPRSSPYQQPQQPQYIPRQQTHPYMHFQPQPHSYHQPYQQQQQQSSYYSPGRTNPPPPQHHSSSQDFSQPVPPSTTTATVSESVAQDPPQTNLPPPPSSIEPGASSSEPHNPSPFSQVTDDASSPATDTSSAIQLGSRLRLRSSSLSPSEVVRRSPLRHSGPSGGRIITLSPQRSPLLDQQRTIGSTSGSIDMNPNSSSHVTSTDSPNSFFAHQSQLHHLPIFEGDIKGPQQQKRDDSVVAAGEMDQPPPLHQSVADTISGADLSGGDPSQAEFGEAFEPQQVKESDQSLHKQPPTPLPDS